ncbi:alkaline phosphatase [Flavobacteriaceae bacterium]|nr:alkaline phosphatase [Flavobacteriaceae bacterium]MDB9987904.1 alkaline phosphatase [Flavobacteriaceae bacterium]|tara:strand:+ start:11495 stop:12544 length:1050 start_codon:yes stop_codon:yes gene_type:complete
MKNIIFLICLTFSLTSITAQEKAPINIILMIGDGMGLNQITAGMYFNGNKTALEDFSSVGLAKTHSSNSLVTDSAASGTAMASGVKTLNGVVGISSKNKKPKSILEISKEKGYQTALIATSSIVHATPASFYAHVVSRKEYENIALQMSTSVVDYFIGGGKKHFNDREDNRNLIKEMSTYDIVSSLSRFDKSTASKIGHFTNRDEPNRILDGRLPLKDAVQSVLNKFDRDQKPFFMMVEGSQIDWGGHSNEIEYVISEFNDFDAAIQTVLDYTLKHPNTLVVVTADHETGGLTIPKGDIKKMRPSVEFSTVGHTASMVPVFAKGPAADTFSGIYDNTLIFNKMLDVLNE